MPKSFIKIKPVTGNSERHNLREVKPKYCIEASAENYHVSDEKIGDALKRIRENYQDKVGQKMQKRATPVREAVVLLKDDDNRKNIHKLFELSDQMEKRFGIRAFQWHIHNDEGHIDKKGEARYNYHAHILFDWTDRETGKTLKLDKRDMSEIQTMTAEVLEMERGIKGSKSLSLNHRQYRGFLEVKDQLEESLNRELTREQEIRIREAIKKDRSNEIKRTDREGGHSL